MSLWNQSGRRGGVHRVLLYISHLINTWREDLVWRLSRRPKKKKKESTHYTSSPMEVESITFAVLTRNNSKESIQEKSCSGTGYSTEHSTGTQTFNSYSMSSHKLYQSSPTNDRKLCFSLLTWRWTSCR